eukprot:2755180-Alexandrium_andersonii.AAC.1
MARVDDFQISGDFDSPVFRKAYAHFEKLYKRGKWGSDAERYVCRGVHVSRRSAGGFRLQQT